MSKYEYRKVDTKTAAGRDVVIYLVSIGWKVNYEGLDETELMRKI